MTETCEKGVNESTNKNLSNNTQNYTLLEETKVQHSVHSHDRLKNLAPLTVIVPAYNEESVIDQTLSSLTTQTWLPEKIIVVDDFSSDHTGEIARSYDRVCVLRPPKNTGSKAGAQSYALPFVNSKYTIAIDADTSLPNNTLEKMIRFMESYPETVSACSFVLPKKVSTIWERGRFIEYMFIFPFYKKVQNWYGKPLISSGCFSIYKTKELKTVGGWHGRTMAEDMDLTWTFYERGEVVRYNHDAYCFPLEPETLTMMSKQLKRWSHGYVQNLRLHWNGIKRVPVLREIIFAGLADTFIGGAVFVVIMPLISIASHNPYLYIYTLFADIFFISIPTILMGLKLKKLRQVLLCLPSYFVLRLINMYFIYGAFISEFLFKRSLNKYEKGH